MENNHLTDETLQAFLLNELQDDAIAIHITGCSICHAKLENYRQLMERINKITPETFSFDVTSVVMHKIEQHAIQENIKHNFIFWGILVALVGGIVLLGFPFLKPIISIFYATSFFTNLFIIGTGLCVVLFFVVDIYKSYNAKEKIVVGNNLQPIA